MFDVGFSELMVIGVVALVVIGPERLPKVARTAGLLLGRLQRYVSDVKADINREMQLDELKKLQQQVSDQVASLEATVTHEMREVETSVNDAIEPPAAEGAVSSTPSSELPPGTGPEATPAADGQLTPASATVTVAAEVQKS